MLLVDHEETEILELDVVLKKAMRANDDVHLAASESLENLLRLRSAAKARKQLDLHRKPGKAPPEGLVVLLGENGRRHQHRN